jgi:hypothetical protein
MAEIIISERAMQAAPGARDRWLLEHGARGAGRLVGRITPAGERRFSYRYTDSHGNRFRLLIGAYDPRGDGGTTFTVKQARRRAVEWQTLHGAGVRDLRAHFAQELLDAERAREDARVAAETARRMAEEAAQADELAQHRRLTMRQAFDRWAATELAPHVGGDDRRIGRKDGGQYVREQFERRVFPGLGHVAVEDVRKAVVLAILDAAKAEGKLRAANMLLADLKQMFRFATEREIIEHSPIELIRQKKIGGKDIKRDRVLSGDGLSALFKQLPTANLNRRTVLGIWLISATGCRVGELMGTVWADAKPHKRALQKVIDAHNVAQKSVRDAAATSRSSIAAFAPADANGRRLCADTTTCAGDAANLACKAQPSTNLWSHLGHKLLLLKITSVLFDLQVFCQSGPSRSVVGHHRCKLSGRAPASLDTHRRQTRRNIGTAQRLVHGFVDLFCQCR